MIRKLGALLILFMLLLGCTEQTSEQIKKEVNETEIEEIENESFEVVEDPDEVLEKVLEKEDLPPAFPE